MSATEFSNRGRAFNHALEVRVLGFKGVCPI